MMPNSSFQINAFELSGLDPASLLAFEEAALDLAELESRPNLLWFWEPTAYFVVLGFSRPIDGDVDLDACNIHRIPIFRRCTGGGTVLQGPGCLNYGMILAIQPDSPWQNISQTNAFIMERQRQALEHSLGAPVLIQGVTDLTLNDHKFSGNAQRRRKHHLLFHGCFLAGLNLAMTELALKRPAQQPSYRRDRSHRDFLSNLALKPAELKASLVRAWNAQPIEPIVPKSQIKNLVREKYSRREWIYRC
jgi:lipoate---protein ligase